MDSKKFYDSILDDTASFDKVIYEMERMSAEAPNPRIRTVADRAIYDLKLAMEICQALRAEEKK